MDRFSISQEAYHELTQQESSLPKTYLVESCQKVIDALWKSTRTPGICPGAELPFELLLEKEIRGHVRVFSSYIGKVGHVFGWLFTVVKPNRQFCCFF